MGNKFAGDLSTIRQVGIRGYLRGLSIAPRKETAFSGMYLSPFRKETEPSFKVDYGRNVWYDHGAGEGGGIIDLVMKMRGCNFSEAVEHLRSWSGQVATSSPAATVATASRSGNDGTPKSIGSTAPTPDGIVITDIRDLSHPSLMGYLRERCIPLDIAKHYCREVHYSVGGKPYFAVGFKNDTGGWELRNPYFKGSSTPKNITTFNNGSDTVMVFEGFTDFLSYLAMKENRRQAESNQTCLNCRGAKEAGEANPKPAIDSAVLNSVSNLGKAMPFIEAHRTIHTFLDNDEPGRKTTTDITRLATRSEVVDQSAFYRQHKDLNDYLRHRETEHRKPKIAYQPPMQKKKRGIGM